jgi:shikimate dehydrogenase
VLVLGTGGVARMFAFEAVLAGAAVTLAARTPSKGCALAAEIAEKCGRAVTVTDFNSVTGDWDLIVNGTPVGMFPKVDACPLEPGVLAHTAAVFDAIYNPMETRLLCLARQNGAKVVNGLPMLVWQAAVAQEIWNDVTYTPAQVQRVIEQMEELL